MSGLKIHIPNPIPLNTELLQDKCSNRAENWLVVPRPLVFILTILNWRKEKSWLRSFLNTASLLLN